MGQPVPSVFCPKGEWTTIEYYVGIVFLTKRYFTDPGTKVRWRYYSAGVPPFWHGKFTGSVQITLYPSASTWLQFNPDVDTTITWEPVDSGLGEPPPDPIDELAH